MKAKPFYFKKFTIHQDRCALKVGTDGVLLGAWANCENAKTVLDIGAGTGVVSLMLAQRFESVFTAIEIDKDATEQCAENFKISPWEHRLVAINNSIQNFAAESTSKFDCIVSNPPFYSIHKETTKRSTARNEQTLTLKELIENVVNLLTENGRFSLIYPFDRKLELLQDAAQFNLFPIRICHVRGTADATIKRILIEFAFGKQIALENELVIEKERHNYTTEYTELCKEYLTIF